MLTEATPVAHPFSGGGEIRTTGATRHRVACVAWATARHCPWSSRHANTTAKPVRLPRSSAAPSYVPLVRPTLGSSKAKIGEAVWAALRPAIDQREDDAPRTEARDVALE